MAVNVLGRPSILGLTGLFDGSDNGRSPPPLNLVRMITRFVILSDLLPTHSLTIIIEHRVFVL